MTVAELPVNGNGHTASPFGITQMPQTLPEAPVSMNLFVDVPGHSKAAQVTGRGITGAEAARNLKEGVDALLLAFAPPAPTPPLSREAQVGTLLAKGIVCAVKNADMSLCERLSKAAFLVLSNAVEPGNEHDTVAVRSQSNPDAFYEVTHGVVCTCKDWERNHAKAGGERFLCKHVLSVIMQKRLT